MARGAIASFQSKPAGLCQWPCFLIANYRLKTHTHIYIIYNNIYVYIYVHIHTYYCEDYVVKQLAHAAYIITASLLNSVPLLLLDGRFVQARLRGYEGASRGRDV